MKRLTDLSPTYSKGGLNCLEEYTKERLKLFQ